MQVHHSRMHHSRSSSGHGSGAECSSSSSSSIALGHTQALRQRWHQGRTMPCCHHHASGGAVLQQEIAGHRWHLQPLCHLVLLNLAVLLMVVAVRVMQLQRRQTSLTHA